MLGAKGLMKEWATIIIVINSFLILDIGEGTFRRYVCSEAPLSADYLLLKEV